MRKSCVLVLLFVATAFMGLGARTASALICCSACDENPNLLACKHGCSPSCVIDAEPIVPDNVVYDDVAKVCYAVTASDSNTNVQTLAL